MKNTVTLEEVISRWEKPETRIPPKFPIVYFEIEKAKDCRGFIELIHLAGDWDFSGYPIDKEDIIVDSNGWVYSLAFDRFVFPKVNLFRLTKENVLDYFLPAICASGDIEFLKEIMACNEDVETIVRKVAKRFSW